MHALYIRYTLRGATAAEHGELCRQLAPALVAVPGLISLTWLSNVALGRFGGFYVFASRSAFDAFIASELYEAFRRQRAIAALFAEDYAIERTPTVLGREAMRPQEGVRND